MTDEHWLLDDGTMSGECEYWYPAHGGGVCDCYYGGGIPQPCTAANCPRRGNDAEEIKSTG